MNLLGNSKQALRLRSLWIFSALFLLWAGLLSPLALGSGSDWTAQVETLIQNKDLAPAEKMVVGKMVTNPRDPVLITLLAQIRFDQRRYREVLQLLDNADQIAGPSAKRATLRGLVAVVENRMDLAEPNFRKAIRLDPNHAFAHYYLGRLLYTENHFSEAIEESKAAIALAPDFVRAYENLGLCYQGQGHFAEAKKWYLEAIQREKTGGQPSEWPFLDLATLLIQNNQTAAADPYLLKALELNPNNPEAHFQKAIVLERKGDLQGALKELQRTASLNPKEAEAYYRAARIYQRLGEKEKAEKQFALFKSVSENRHNPNQGQFQSSAQDNPK